MQSLTLSGSVEVNAVEDMVLMGGEMIQNGNRQQVRDVERDYDHCLGDGRHGECRDSPEVSE